MPIRMPVPAPTAAFCSLLSQGLRDFAGKTDWRPRQLPRVPDLEIDFSYGSRLTINSQ